MCSSDLVAFRERLILWRDLIRRYSLPEGSALDLGCGSGVFSFLAAGSNREVIAVDGSPEMIELGQRRLGKEKTENLSFKCARLEQLEFSALGRFDLVLCSSVLEYLEDFWGTINWIKHALVPRGVLILSVPNQRSIYRQLERMVFRTTGRPRYYAHVKQRWKAEELLAALERQGMDVLETIYYAPTPFFSPICRLLGKPLWSDNLFVMVCRRAG